MTSPEAATAAPMRVAYLVNQYPKVSHSFIRREILALERRGVEVLRFAVRGWDAETPDAADAAEKSHTRYLLREGARGLLAAMGRAFLASPRRFANALVVALRSSVRADRPFLVHLVYLGEACRLHEWLRDAGATHLHAHFGTNPAEVALLVSELGGPPYSFTVHGPEEFDRPEALHLAAKIHEAAFVVAVSSYGRSQLYRWAGHEDWPRIEVVHCGLDAAFLGAAVSMPSDRPRLLCVGRLCEQKGQLLLIEATARLVAAGIAVEVVLAGDGELRRVIEEAIDRHGLAAHVRITGWLDSDGVRAEMLDARALVLPSFAEGLPVVVMEAMALCRPVLSTFVAGIPELVRDGVDGWLVPAGDIDALVQAMKECLAARPQNLAQMGLAARARVIGRHDIDVEAAKLERLFARSSPVASAAP